MDTAAFLAQARVGRLATVDRQGRPHVVPVCFAVDAGCVYIALDEKPKRVAPERLRRVRNLLANPQVQLLVDRYDEDWSLLSYIQVRGRAGLLDSGPDHAAAIALLRAKYPQYGAMDLDRGLVIRIEVEQTVTWDASAP